MRHPRARGRDHDLDFLETPAATLAKYRIAEELGLNLKIHIKTTAKRRTCAACHKIAGNSYSIDDAPTLPLPGCGCEGRCAARYVAELIPANDRGIRRRKKAPREAELSKGPAGGG